MTPLRQRMLEDMQVRRLSPAGHARDVSGLSVRQTALTLGVFICLIRNRISATAGARSGV